MVHQPLLLALDQGTSSSRAALFNTSGDLIASASAPLSIDYPADGWVEQDPQGIWDSQLKSISNLERQLEEEQLRAIISCGITNQRETTVLWRRSTGKPCGPAIVWQDGRTADICRTWAAEGLEKEWKSKTGLLLDPYFSASKIQWLLSNECSAQEALKDKDLCFGTVESWILWNLTGGEKHCSDMSNASRTLLMDLKNRQWEEKFCDIIGLPLHSLPELVPCRGDFGKINKNLPFGGVPIQALLGDQQAATLGQLCLNKGSAKCTYGTGAFLVVNTNNEICFSKSGLLSTLGWTDEKGNPTYCVEGSLFNAGTVVQWLRDGLGLIEKAEEINTLANEVQDSAGVMLVPAFTGLGTPHWDPSARGLIIGLTRNTQRGHIAKAALEGIALSVASLIDLAEEALSTSLGELAVDGGAAASDPLLQAQADCTGLTVRRPENLESTAKGVALLAGIQAKLINNLDHLISKRKQSERLFKPQIDSAYRQILKGKWNEAVKRSLHWHE